MSTGARHVMRERGEEEPEDVDAADLKYKMLYRFVLLSHTDTLGCRAKRIRETGVSQHP